MKQKTYTFRDLLRKYKLLDSDEFIDFIFDKLELELPAQSVLTHDTVIDEGRFVRWYALILAQEAAKLNRRVHELMILSDKMYNKYFEL